MANPHTTELVLEFLFINRYYRAVRELEKQSSASVFPDLGAELNFLKELVLEGEWENVETTLRLLDGNLREFDLSRSLFVTRRQSFLELLVQEDAPPPGALKAAFDRLSSLPQAANMAESLRQVLVSFNPQLLSPGWTLWGGRYRCFFELLDGCGLQALLPNQLHLQLRQLVIHSRVGDSQLDRVLRNAQQKGPSSQKPTTDPGVSTNVNPSVEVVFRVNQSQNPQTILSSDYVSEPSTKRSWSPPPPMIAAEKWKQVVEANEQNHRRKPVAFDVLLDNKLENKLGGALVSPVPANVLNATQGRRMSPAEHFGDLSREAHDILKSIDVSQDRLRETKKEVEQDDELFAQIKTLSEEVLQLKAQLGEQRNKSASSSSSRPSSSHQSTITTTNERDNTSRNNQAFGEWVGDESFAPPTSPEEPESPPLPTTREEEQQEEQGRPLKDLSNQSQNEPLKMSSVAKDQAREGTSQTHPVRMSKPWPQSFEEMRDPRFLSCTTTFHPCVTFLEESQPVRCVAFSGSGSNLAVGTNSRSVALCEFPFDMEQLGASSARLMALDPDSENTNGHIQYVHRKDQDRELRLRLPYHQRPNVHRGSVYCMDWVEENDGSHLLATGSNDKHVKVWRLGSDLTSFSQVGFSMDQKSTVRSLRFLFKGNDILASVGGGDNQVRLWDVQTCQLASSLQGHSGAVFDLDYVHADGESTVLTSSTDGTVRVWDLRQRQSAAVLSAPSFSQSGAHSVACSPTNPNRFASGYADGNCFMWDLKMRKATTSLHHHSDDVRTLQFSPDGNWLLTGSFDGSVGLSDLDSFAVSTVATFKAHVGKVLQVRWHPTKPYFVSSSTEGTVKGWTMACSETKK